MQQTRSGWRSRKGMTASRRLRLIEIADLLGVTKQRAHQLADGRVPRAGRTGRTGPVVEPA